jgi:hypothetical protein
VLRMRPQRLHTIILLQRRKRFELDITGNLGTAGRSPVFCELELGVRSACLRIPSSVLIKVLFPTPSRFRYSLFEFLVSVEPKKLGY